MFKPLNDPSKPLITQHQYTPPLTTLTSLPNNISNSFTPSNTSPPFAKLTLGAPMDYQLMNFNIPTHLKHNLDLIAKYKHISRTSIVNRLLDLYCRQELKNLEDSKRIEQLINPITRPVKAANSPLEFEQPVNIVFDGSPPIFNGVHL